MYKLIPQIQQSLYLICTTTYLAFPESECITHFCSEDKQSVYNAWELPGKVSPSNNLRSC